jgi:adenine-specific DNA-methyltransferase
MSEPQVDARDIPYNRIFVGDCRDLLKRLPDECVDLIVASPQLRYTVTHRRGPGAAKYQTYEAVLKILQPFLKEQTEVLTGCARILKSTGAIFWHVGIFREHAISIPLDVRIFGVLESLGMTPRGRIILTSELAGNAGHPGAGSRSNYSTYVWFSKSQNFTYNPASDEAPHPIGFGEVLALRSISAPDEEKTRHPAQDPEEIVARIVASASCEQDVVFDPYMGSGTTAAVAVKMNRRFMGAEIDKGYVDIALERLEKAASLEPVRDPLRTFSRRIFVENG